MEIAELGTALIVPRPGSSSILQGKGRIRQVKGSIVDRRYLKHEGPDNSKHLIKSFVFEGGAESSPAPVLDLEDQDIRPIEHEFSCSQLLGVELFLEGNSVCSETHRLGVSS